MHKKAEERLWDLVKKIPASGYVGGIFASARGAIEELLKEGLIQNPKQAWRTLEKWQKQGCYDYGVTLDLGWAVPGKEPRKRIDKDVVDRNSVPMPEVKRVPRPDPCDCCFSYPHCADYPKCLERVTYDN